MIKAIIFDLDGLLVNTEIISYKVYKQMLAPYGHSYTIEEYAKYYSGITEVNNIKNLLQTYHLPLSFEEASDLSFSLENEYIQKGVELKEGAIKLLNYLKKHNYKLAIASSSKEERALTMLNQNKITEYFDCFTFGYEVEKGKPNPDIFLKACEKLSIPSDECLVLEDSEAGIMAAHNANIPVICIPDLKIPQDSFQEMCTAVLSSLYDVISFLEENK